MSKPTQKELDERVGRLEQIISGLDIIIDNLTAELIDEDKRDVRIRILDDYDRYQEQRNFWRTRKAHAEAAATRKRNKREVA